MTKEKQIVKQKMKELIKIRDEENKILAEIWEIVK